jgi:hypothetical protein
MYGWVCAKCADELERYVRVQLGLTGGTVASVYHQAKRLGQLPPPGPR